MSELIKLGSTFTVESWIANTNGSGHIELSMLVAVRRLSDNYYLDFDDTTFKSSGWTTRQVAMTEVSISVAPGLYQYVLDTSDLGAVGDYSIESSYSSGIMSVATRITLADYELGDIYRYMYNKKIIDKSLATPQEVLYEDNGTTEKARWNLTSSNLADSRIPL